MDLGTSMMSLTPFAGVHTAYLLETQAQTLSRRQSVVEPHAHADILLHGAGNCSDEAHIRICRESGCELPMADSAPQPLHPQKINMGH